MREIRKKLRPPKRGKKYTQKKSKKINPKDRKKKKRRDVDNAKKEKKQIQNNGYIADKKLGNNGGKKREKIPMHKKYKEKFEHLKKVKKM